MKRLAWICLSLVLGCGGSEGKAASGAKEDAGRAGRDGGSDADDDPPASGGMRADGGSAKPDGAIPAAGGGSGVRVSGVLEDAGVEGDQVLSKLTPEQRESLCRAQVAQLLSAVTLEDECTLDAVFETDDPRSCNKQVSQCVGEGRANAGENERVAVEDCVAGLVKCPFTVDVLQRCVKEEHAEWARITSAYSCDQAGDREFSRDLQPRISDTCQKLQSSCYSL